MHKKFADKTFSSTIEWFRVFVCLAKRLHICFEIPHGWMASQNHNKIPRGYFVLCERLKVNSKRLPTELYGYACACMFIRFWFGCVLWKIDKAFKVCHAGLRANECVCVGCCFLENRITHMVALYEEKWGCHCQLFRHSSGFRIALCFGGNSSKWKIIHLRYRCGVCVCHFIL